MQTTPIWSNPNWPNPYEINDREALQRHLASAINIIDSSDEIAEMWKREFKSSQRVHGITLLFCAIGWILAIVGWANALSK